MKKIVTFLLLLVALCVSAQKKTEEKSKEKSTTESSSSGGTYGNTLNLSVGFGYGYGYGKGLYASYPLLLNYELDVAKNFTIAPFIGFYSYSYYYGSYNWNKNYYDHTYRTTVVPVGAKGFYYFDDVLQANEKWDFYLAFSLGFAYRHTVWDNGYNAPLPSNSASSLFGELHIGAEYHLNQKVGLFFDLSSGVSSFGLSIKTK